MRRLLKRRIVYHKKQRPDMPSHWKERLNYSFLRLVWDYDKKYRNGLVKELDKFKHKLVILHNSHEVQQFTMNFNKKYT